MPHTHTHSDHWIRVLGRKTLFLFLGIAWLSAAEGSETTLSHRRTDPVAGGPRYAVGYRVVDVPRGEGNIPVAVWYPATVRSTSAGRARMAPNAPFKEGRWPLFVFSHGFSGGEPDRGELPPAWPLGDGSSRPRTIPMR